MRVTEKAKAAPTKAPISVFRPSSQKGMPGTIPPRPLARYGRRSASGLGSTPVPLIGRGSLVLFRAAARLRRGTLQLSVRAAMPSGPYDTPTARRVGLLVIPGYRRPKSHGYPRTSSVAASDGVVAGGGYSRKPARGGVICSSDLGHCCRCAFNVFLRLRGLATSSRRASPHSIGPPRSVRMQPERSAG